MMETSPITLRFHRSLYRPQSVAAAAERFTGLARVEVTTDGDEIRVTLTEVSARARPRIADELKNHALFQTIVDLRAAEDRPGGV